MPTVLVVDDEPVFLEGVKNMLHRFGYETIEANSAADGFRLARIQQPNLIVSDVAMTSDDGFGLLTDLRANPLTATIPVILMSGGTDIEKARRSMALGADDFLEKPFRAEWLIESVKAQLRKHDKVHQEAVETKARMVAILEATPNLVSIVDASTQNVVYLNRAGHRMLSLGDDLDVADCRLSNFFSPERYALIEREALPSALKGGIWRGDTQLLTAEDREIHVSVLLQAHKGIEGNVEFFSLVIHDQTEHRRAEAERQKVELQLRNAQKLESIGRLAAGIAHEINTPTQYIGDNTRFLKDAFSDLRVLIDRADELLTAAETKRVTPDLIARVREARTAADLELLEEEIPKAIEQSLMGIDRVTKIVRAMKEFSHPGSEEKAPLDINRAIETTLTVCRNEWKYVADIVTNFAPDLSPVTCLGGQFNQVILNLVVNAAHAIGDTVGDGAKGKGKIEITTANLDHQVEIRIKDSGTGIPLSIREHLFEPFFTTKGVGKGTGQGLALARTIVVDQHGGTIDYETEVGKGTAFIVRLPLHGS